MVAALASLPIPRPPHLTLVKPAVDRAALRTAHVLSTFVEECLSLDAADARQLQKHFGWMPDASLRLGVRSVPSHVAGLVICSELRRIVGDADTWPAGFYTEGEALRFNCEKRYGLILPVWRRWPVGLMWYSHSDLTNPDPKRRARRMWITSTERETGAAPSPSVHCQAMHEDPAEVTRAFVVSHTLEALAVAIKQGVSCVGYNATPCAAVPAQMFEAFPKLRAVVLALADVPPAVVARLERELKGAGLNVTTWAGGELL